MALGRPHWCRLELRAHDDHRAARVVHAFAEQVLLESGPACPSACRRATSRDQLATRPRMAFERRPLSNSASTASWSIRLSRSGRVNHFRRPVQESASASRLLPLITRRYRSFRSDVADCPRRPAAPAAAGRAGVTGITSRIIPGAGLPQTSPGVARVADRVHDLEPLQHLLLAMLAGPSVGHRGSRSSLGESCPR